VRVELSPDVWFAYVVAFRYQTVGLKLFIAVKLPSISYAREPSETDKLGGRLKRIAVLPAIVMMTATMMTSRTDFLLGR